jgi:hypothetical protein
LSRCGSISLKNAGNDFHRGDLRSTKSGSSSLKFRRSSLDSPRNQRIMIFSSKAIPCEITDSTGARYSRSTPDSLIYGWLGGRFDRPAQFRRWAKWKTAKFCGKLGYPIRSGEFFQPRSRSRARHAMDRRWLLSRISNCRGWNRALWKTSDAMSVKGWLRDGDREIKPADDLAAAFNREAPKAAVRS